MTAAEKLTECRNRLINLYGRQKAFSKRSPVQELVMTILSHRTDYVSEKKAFEQMWERFGSWQAIEHAPLDELIRELSPVRYPEVKAPYIQKSLALINKEQGDYTLDFLADYTVDEALEWLKKLPGVGPKTATLLLLFNFKMPVLPVDTHVHRVCSRVGLLPPRTSANKAHDLLLSQLPKDADTLFTFHKNFFWHGQRICHYYQPKCNACVLQNLCEYNRELRQARTTSNSSEGQRTV